MRVLYLPGSFIYGIIRPKYYIIFFSVRVTKLDYCLLKFNFKLAQFLKFPELLPV